MDRVTGIGIIGCGIAADSYFRGLPGFKGLEIRACADLNRGMAERAAQTYGIESRTVSSLLQSPDVDLIVNLTSADAHYAVGMEVLRARKHLFSEKPMTLSFEQAETLQTCAIEHRRGIGVAPDTFLTPAYCQARHLLAREAIGKTSFATCRVMNRGAEIRHPKPGSHYLEGQGPLTHQGPYCVSALVALFGGVERVSGLALTSAPRRKVVSLTGEEVDFDIHCTTTLQGLLQFRNGMQVSLILSWDIWDEGLSGIEIFGTQGSIRLPDPTGYSGDLVMTLEGKPQQLDCTGVVPGGRSGLIASSNGTAVPSGRPNRPEEDFYRGLALADMARALREGGTYRCSVYLAVHVVEVLEALERAAREGRVIDLKTDCHSPDPLNDEEISGLLQA